MRESSSVRAPAPRRSEDDPIRGLFPEGVVALVSHEAFWGGALHPAEEKLVRNALAKRRREFTAGRVCARRALARLAVPEAPLLADADRVPRWPDGVVGSLSHSRGRCAVAVARRGEILGLGIDVEEAGAVEARLFRRILTPGEERVLARLDPAAASQRATLVFSAKESAYKCYFPEARTFLGFHDAEVDFEPDAGSFAVRLLRDAAPSLHGRRVLHGRFHVGEGYVLTGIALTR